MPELLGRFFGQLPDMKESNVGFKNRFYFTGPGKRKYDPDRES